jgi:Holliday junction resolvase RusA-like endonuclease
MMINGRPVVVEGSSTAGRKALKLWQHTVECVRYHYHEAPLTEPVEVVIDFHMPVVMSDPHRTRHCVKPDLDKLCRAVLDSFTKAGVWKDDALVCSLYAKKRYVDMDEEPGCQVTVICMGEHEAVDRAQRKQRRRGGAPG